ncbi:HAD-IC family P-type ATPase [Candidatus Saccharibacteria bacterium oral taxon 488]|nr:HAD-IC family P-type ATPase [Candidatus Saccharibacteria bacterium oral taxon 488]
MRDYLDIIKRNLLSPIVLAIFLLAGALIYVREYRDAWFISVVIVVNSLIGIVQEIRAKRVLHRLELMSAPRARVLRDGQAVEVPYDSLVVGDEIILRAGDELPADATVMVSKGLELNESMLTGESAAVEKAAGDTVLAATTVLAGEGTARVTAVGDQTKAGAISQVLKRYKPELTPLQRAIWRAISFLTYGAIILAALIFIVYYLSGDNMVIILKTITSSAVTVVPEGLLLASSLLLAFGSLRLAQAKVLPQKLAAIEAMALLNLLAVDKTGTLTSDEVTLERVVAFDEMGVSTSSATATSEKLHAARPVVARVPDFSESAVASFAALIAHETSGGNITGQAILAEITPPKHTDIIEVMAFSSARKMAGVRAKIDGKTRTLMMGAPEFVAKLAPVDAMLQRQLDEWADSGLRVLMLAEFDDETAKLKDLPDGSGRAIGAVILRNSLRDGVIDTVKFLQEQGVVIRVISGDNPRTVQHIARQAGIANPDKAILGSALAGLSDKAFNKAADEHTIFARVLPEQKERLIAHFKQSGKFTGMVGDGVNDALALKKSDLGVAMYAGAPASRRVADIILLNNSFTSLPIGMKLGNRIMQAIEVIATLFFHKIIYGVVLLLSTMLVGLNYPYAPRHITFLNIFLVTMPTIMWTLFPPRPRHRVNPAHFWRDTLRAVAPIALLTGLTVAFTYWSGVTLHPHQAAEAATMTVLTATFFGIYLVFLVGPMLGVILDKRAHLARTLYMAGVLFVTLVSFGIEPLRQFFDFTMPNIALLWPGIAVVVPVALAQWWLARRAGRKFADMVEAADERMKTNRPE